MTLNNSAISGNVASGTGQGGGIDSSGTTTLNNSTISGNSALHGEGISTQGGTVALVNSAVVGNSALNGGGIYDYSGMGGVSVTGSTISGNIAGNGTTLGYGGGIYYANPAPNQSLFIVNSTISDNTASGLGGANFNSQGTVIVASSTIAGNNSGVSSESVILVRRLQPFQRYLLHVAHTAARHKQRQSRCRPARKQWRTDANARAAVRQPGN